MSHNNKVTRRNFGAYQLCIKLNGYSLLYRAARLFICRVSIQITEMREPICVTGRKQTIIISRFLFS